MKKIIVFLMCVFALSAMAAEPTCEDHGGSIITAKDGTKFCKSDKNMNWWTAFAWCESQNRKLAADLSKMCPNVAPYPRNETGDCPNLQGLAESGWLWSSLAYDSGRAIFVNLSSGAMYNGNRYDNYGYAFCE